MGARCRSRKLCCAAAAVLLLLGALNLMRLAPEALLGIQWIHPTLGRQPRGGRTAHDVRMLRARLPELNSAAAAMLLERYGSVEVAVSAFAKAVLAAPPLCTKVTGWPVQVGGAPQPRQAEDPMEAGVRVRSAAQASRAAAAVMRPIRVLFLQALEQPAAAQCHRSLPPRTPHPSSEYVIRLYTHPSSLFCEMFLQPGGEGVS